MKYLLPLLIVGLLWSCGEQPSTTASVPAGMPAATTVAANTTPIDPPMIEVQVKGLTGGQARLIGMYTDQNYLADTASVDAQGRFTFHKAEAYKPGFFFVVLPDQSNFQMMIDRDQQFKLTTTLNRLAEDMQVDGCLETQLFYENLRYEQVENPKFTEVNQKMKGVSRGTPQYNELKSQQDALVAKRKAYITDLQNKYPGNLFVNFKVAGQNPDLQEIYNADGTLNNQAQIAVYRKQFWDNVNFSDVRLLSTPVISNKLKRYVTELTTQQQDSIKISVSQLIDRTLNYPEYFQYFANWTMLHYEPDKTTLMDPQAVFVHMVNNYFTYDRAFWSDSTEIYAIQLRAYEMSRSLVGQKGPDVRAQDPTGKFRAISEIKSPYIIVYMFDPNCENCAVETPKLAQFSRAWKGKGVTIFSIALNTNDAEWKGYIAKNGLGDWVNVHDPTNKAIYATYFVDHTPELYVLNPERTIIAKNLKVEQIATVIERDQAK